MSVQELNGNIHCWDITAAPHLHSPIRQGHDGDPHVPDQFEMFLVSGLELLGGQLPLPGPHTGAGVLHHPVQGQPEAGRPTVGGGGPGEHVPGGDSTVQYLEGIVECKGFKSTVQHLVKVAQ